MWVLRLSGKQDSFQDVLCVEFPEQPKWLIGCEVSDCGDYLIVTTHSECKYNIVYLAK